MMKFSTPAYSLFFSILVEIPVSASHQVKIKNKRDDDSSNSPIASAKKPDALMRKVDMKKKLRRKFRDNDGLGILSPDAHGEFADERHLEDEGCPDKVIKCNGGMTFYAALGEFITCEEACAGKCCVGDRACEGFTGDVCQDGKSCIGSEACNSADIDSVFYGCHGVSSCALSDFDSVSRGCYGEKSCFDARFGSVSNGCDGTKACVYVGYTGGHVGVIQDACNSASACYRAAVSGSIPSIINGCNNISACYKAAYSSGDIISPGIFDCCNDEDECKDVANQTSLPMMCGTMTPTTSPTQAPSASNKPSIGPSLSTSPSSQPSGHPSVSGKPSSQPSLSPTSTGVPSSLPSESPSVSWQPSSMPSENPSISAAPSSQPSGQPSQAPITPTQSPTTMQPTYPPTPSKSKSSKTAKSKSSKLSKSKSAKSSWVCGWSNDGWGGDSGEEVEQGDDLLGVLVDLLQSIQDAGIGGGF